MTMKNVPDELSGASPVSSRLQRWNSTPAHLLALAGLTAYYVAASWRRWPDPLIDFGDDLYRAWRIAQGAVLYRDVDGFYGPLSDYINATIFALLGPGMMHLVWANLAVFGAILATLYCLLRRAWGPGAALFASAVFVSVFGFSHFGRISNYTYAAPYSHEATHGLLVLLLLLAVLGRWLENPNRLWGFAAGILFGLSAVLKLEIMLAALLLTTAAGTLHWRRADRVGVRGVAIWVVGAVLPTLLFFGYFARHLSFRDAWGAACHVWLNFSATVAVARNPITIGFLGFDRPWDNLEKHIQATFMAVAMIAIVLVLGKIADREPNPLMGVAIGAAMVAGVLGTAWWAVSWILIGRCLLGLMLLYLMWHL